MLTAWNKLLNTECVVVDVGPHTVYPIFRVGQSTLMSVCDTKYVNEQIYHCNHVDVMIREPEARFVSGVNEYCVQHNLDIDVTWKLINEGKLVHLVDAFVQILQRLHNHTSIQTHKQHY